MTCDILWQNQTMNEKTSFVLKGKKKTEKIHVISYLSTHVGV